LWQHRELSNLYGTFAFKLVALFPNGFNGHLLSLFSPLCTLLRQQRLPLAQTPANTGTASFYALKRIGAPYRLAPPWLVRPLRFVAALAHLKACTLRLGRKLSLAAVRPP
jgi:hypothetical protein